MKRTDLEKLLTKLGWVLNRHGAKHDVWSNGERKIAVPRHSEINEYTAQSILKDAKGLE